jgi:hypothetical protein
VGKHRAHRPWWKPGGASTTQAWAPEPPHVTPVPPPPPEPDEVVLVHDPRTNAPMAVYRRFVRE